MTKDLSFTSSFRSVWNFSSKDTSTFEIAGRGLSLLWFTALGPDLSGHHCFFGAHRGHEVLLAEELQWELNQEAPDFLQQLLSFNRIFFVKASFGLEIQELLFVPHQAGGQAAENLRWHGKCEVSRLYSNRNFKNFQKYALGRQQRIPNIMYLLINGGVPTRDSHPHVFVESVADGVIHIDGWITKGT